MIGTYPIGVSASGVVLLGKAVSCDGFHRDYKVRVQTHIHTDHMEEFETSKGYQDILLTAPTRELLCAEYNADIPFRDNIIVVPTKQPQTINGESIELVPNEHMLGAVQVAVTMSDGRRLGYSGDFQWPMETPISVDALVIDSTYGSPQSCRRYTQGEAEARLLELVVTKLKWGSVHIKAHRGTLQRGAQVLFGNIDVPFVGTPRFCREASVYQDFGFALGSIIAVNSAEGRTALKSGRYIRFYGIGDELPADPSPNTTTVTLSAFMADPYDPVLEYTSRSYRVAMSNHADFDGTMEYIKATGAKYIVTDSSRSEHALELALEIKKQLGIVAVPSTTEQSLEWGV
jgi:putative mRNA 3-end processing factor